MIVQSSILVNKKNNISRLSRPDTGFSNLLEIHLNRFQNTLDEKDSNEPLKDNFHIALDFVLKHEGEALVRRDGIKKESSKYGILQSTAEAFGYKGDIRYLTKEQAKDIYKKIWERSKAYTLPYPLNIIYFDTYVNSPNMAKKILEKSNGDIEKFLNMREQRYIKLAEKRPEIFGMYLKGWKNRVNNLRIAFTNSNTKKV